MNLRIIAFCCLFLLSPPAFAAAGIAWKSYLFAVMGIALVVGGVMAFRNPKAESTAAKLLLAGLYFWVITFAELIVLAMVFYFTKK